MSPPRGGGSWKWSDTENQSKPLASANFHSLRISASGPPMWPMWIPNFISSLLLLVASRAQRRETHSHDDDPPEHQPPRRSHAPLPGHTCQHEPRAERHEE